MSRNGDKSNYELTIRQANAKLAELKEIKETLNNDEQFNLVLQNNNFDIEQFTQELTAYQKRVDEYKAKYDSKTLIGKYYPYVEFINQNRKVSKCELELVEKALIDTIRFIDNINSMEEDQTLITGFYRNLDETFIPSMFKDWIRPRSIRYILGDLKCIDMSNRPAFKGWEVAYPDGTKRLLTYNHLLTDWMIIYRHFKSDYQSALVSISSLRRDVTFNDILSIASIKGKVNYQNNPFIPVPLHDDCALFFHDAYFNATEAEILQDWFTSFEM